jgi:hypothetical protein
MRQDPTDWVHRRNRDRVKSLRTKAYLAQITLGTLLVYWMGVVAILFAYKSGWDLPPKATDVLASTEMLYPWLLLATATLFVIWSYGAHSNLKLFDRRGIRHADQATIWWWLVPFAGFVMPFRVVHETARGSVAQTDEIHWNDLDSPAIARWWTGLFVTGLIASTMGGGMIGAATTIERFASAANVLLVGSVLMVAAALTAIGLIQVVTMGQVSLANEQWPAWTDFPITAVPPTGHGYYQPPSHTG